MAEDIVNIIHRITYDVQDRELDHAVRTVQGNIAGIENLTRRQIRLVEQYNRTGAQDVQTRQRINRMINQNTTALNHHRRSLEDNLVSNRSLNQALNQEIGLVGNLERRLQILSQARRRATSQTEINRYNNLISGTRTQLNATNPAQNVNQNGGLLSGLGLGAGGGAVARLLPMIGGAIGISQLGSQIKDVTQRFESYQATLKNTFQSSIRANDEFAKIKDFAEKTPYSVDELTSSFIKLANRGFVPTTEELTNIGDLAASQGKSFDQLVEAILDAQTNEYERLKEFGITAKTAGDTVTLSFKGVEKQIKKTDEQGLRNAIISLGKLQGIAGATATQSQTLSGQISNLGDSFDGLFSAIGSHGKETFSGLIEAVKETVDWFTELIEKSPADSLREQQSEINGLIIAIASMNEKEQARSLLISELNSKYPELLNNIDLEKVSNQGLLNILDSINLSYEKRIRNATIAAKTELAGDNLKKFVRTYADAAKNPNLSKGLKATGFLDEFNSVSETNYTERLKVVQKSRQKVFFTSGNSDQYNALVDYETALSKMNTEYKRIQEDFKDASKSETRAKIQDLADVTSQIMNQTIKVGQLEQQWNKLTKAQQKDNPKLQQQLFDEQAKLQALKNVSGNYNREVELPKPTPETKKTKPKKSKKTKDPNEIAIEKIDQQMKIEQEQEKQRFEQKKSQLLSNLESELIDRETYNQRLTEAVESNSQKLLEIELKYAKQRPKYLKQAEKEANQTRIDELNNSFKEYADAIRKRSEQLIKQLIDDQKNIDDDIFKLTADSRAKELKSSKRDSNSKIDSINKQLSSLYTTNDNLTSDLNSSNPDVVKSATNQQVVVNANIKKLQELRAKIVEDGRIKEREINLKYDLQQLDDLKDLADKKIDVYTDSEQRRFFRLYQEELDNNDRELRNLRDKLSKSEDTENLSRRKRLKAEKQFNKDSEELAYRTDLAKLFSDKKTFEDKIKRAKSGYDKLTDEEKKGRDKIIQASESGLGSTQKNIELKVSERRKKKNEDTNNSNWTESDEVILKTFEEIHSYITLATNAASTFIEVLQNALSTEISIREKRVERAKQIAERGNAELLQLEEERLRKVEAQQEKHARTQMAINSAMAISESIVAVARAAKDGGGWFSIATVLATIGALASGFAMVKSMTQDNISGFKDGVVGLHGTGSETSDSIPARLSRGESVITAKGTNAGDNAEILRMMNDGTAFSIPEMHQMINSVSNISTPNLKMKEDVIVSKNKSEKNNDFKELKSEIIELRQAVENQKPSSFSIDQDGVVAMTNAVNEKKRKRDLL